MWNTCAGDRSTKRSERNTSRIWPISSSVSLLGGTGRGVVDLGRGGAWWRSCVPAGPPLPAQQRALRAGVGEACVLIQNGELVRGVEASTLRLRGGIVVTHAAIMGAREQGCSGHGHGVYVILFSPRGMVGYSRCLTSA